MKNYTFFLESLEAYQKLIESQECQDICKIEEEKLILLKEMFSRLSEDVVLPFSPIWVPPAACEVPPQFKPYLYYLLLFFGVVEDLANSFFFGSALFELLIPTITGNSLFIFSVVYACIEAFLFYIYDSFKLCDTLKMADQHFAYSRLLSLYEEQIDQTIELYQWLRLMSFLEINEEEYRSFIFLMQLNYQDLHQKYKHLHEEKLSFLYKILQWFVLVFGAISSLAGSYFMVTTFLTFFCLPLMGTMLGYGIIVGTMAVGLLYHYMMETTSLTRLINPDYERLHAVKRYLSQFSQDKFDDEYLQQYSSFRKKYHPDVSEVATQTEEAFVCLKL